MNKKLKFSFFLLYFLVFAAVLFLFFYTEGIAVLNPKGIIAQKQKELIVIAGALMGIVVIPVFVLTFYLAWKYRANNKHGKYSPDWEHNSLAEWIWWGVPCIIIFVLGWITYRSCHELDPFKPIGSEHKPLKIQVVALQWKWLFIYPEQEIATVNFLQFPAKVPLSFEITADAPMNSFWIPQLGGQIYAMAGMRSKLHLMADVPGEFRGCSSNFSGAGFSGMTFTAKASSEEEFAAWVTSVKNSSQVLTQEEYARLVKPSSYDPVVIYSLSELQLFDQIMMKYTERDSKIGRCQGGAPILSQAQLASKPHPKDDASLGTPQLNLNKLSDADGLKSGGCPTPAEPILESRAVFMPRKP